MCPRQKVRGICASSGSLMKFACSIHAWNAPARDATRARSQRDGRQQEASAAAPGDGRKNDLMSSANGHFNRLAPQIPPPAWRPGCYACGPGLVRKHHLCTDALRQSKSVRGDGLAFAQSARLGAFKYNGRLALPGGVDGRCGTKQRAARDLQYRSGQPVCPAGMDRETYRLGIKISMDGKGR
ncbi:MAG: hypothetical protein JWL59_4692 [Chthoniobacteraceae bacterium]|nr:hypothetical protein [Chthoniobacteraceae bacterium]